MGAAAYDEIDCIDKSDLEHSDFLMSTLVDVCDCVPRSMQKIYYNPAMLATSAMLIPNILRMFLLAKKYAIHFILTWNISVGLFHKDDILRDLNETWDSISGKICVGIDVLALVSNIAIGVAAMGDYFSNPELTPNGGNLCFSTHATFGVMYKPIVLSFFGAVVAVFDVVYWNSIEMKPKPLRRAMGHADHPENPSLDQNFIVYTCMAIVAVTYIAWASVSLTFLPLAVPFFAIVILFGLFIPFFAIFGMSEVLRRAEGALDKIFFIKGKDINVDKSLFVKAILVQLISTVVLLATTSSFYLDKDWTASYERLAALAQALQYDFAFDVDFTFGWPKLPHLGEIYFLFALSVLAFQIFLKYSIRLYYGSGANTFGTSTLRKALEHQKKSNKFGDHLDANVINAIILLHNVLSSALRVATMMDMFVLKLSAHRKFIKAKENIERQRMEAPKRLPEEFESAKRGAKNKYQEISKLRAEAKYIDLKIAEQDEVFSGYQQVLAKAPRTIKELNQMLFLSQLERNAATGGTTYGGIADVSLSPVEAFEVRDGIGSFLFGTTSELPTSTLIVKLFENDLPDFKRLDLGDLGDVVDGHALSVLLKRRDLDPNFIVCTNYFSDDNTQVDGVLNVSLQELDGDVDDVNLSWLTIIRADISGIETWSRCRNIDMSACKEIYGMIPCYLA